MMILIPCFQPGWVKINSDGVFFICWSERFLKGCIKNHLGEYLAGFSIAIGSLPLPMLNFGYFYLAIEIVVSSCLLHLESDFQVAIHLLTKGALPFTRSFL